MILVINEGCLQQKVISDIPLFHWNENFFSMENFNFCTSEIVTFYARRFLSYGLASGENASYIVMYVTNQCMNTEMLFCYLIDPWGCQMLAECLKCR